MTSYPHQKPLESKNKNIRLLVIEISVTLQRLSSIGLNTQTLSWSAASGLTLAGVRAGTRKTFHHLSKRLQDARISQQRQSTITGFSSVIQTTKRNHRAVCINSTRILLLCKRQIRVTRAVHMRNCNVSS